MWKKNLEFEDGNKLASSLCGLKYEDLFRYFSVIGKYHFLEQRLFKDGVWDEFSKKGKELAKQLEVEKRRLLSEIKRYKINYSLDQVRLFKINSEGLRSLDAQVKDDGNDSSDTTLGDLIQDNNTLTPEQIYEMDDLSNGLKELLNNTEKVNAKEREIIRLRYGICLEKPLTEEEIINIFKNEKANRTELTIVEELNKSLNYLKQHPEEANYIIYGNKDKKSKLSDYQRELVSLKTGIGFEEPYTLEMVGDIFGVTRERIRQIETKTLQRLKISAKVRYIGLREYI